MRFWGLQFTIRRLMILVALLGVASALLRVHPSLAALAAGVSSTAFIRTCEKVDRSRAAGRPLGSWGVLVSCLDSVVVAFSILGASILPAIVIMPIALPARLHELDGNVAIAIMLSASAGLPIALCLRRRMW